MIVTAIISGALFVAGLAALITYPIARSHTERAYTDDTPIPTLPPARVDLLDPLVEIAAALADPWPLFAAVEADWARRMPAVGEQIGPLWADILDRHNVCTHCRSGQHGDCPGCSCRHDLLDDLDLDLMMLGGLMEVAVR